MNLFLRIIRNQSLWILFTIIWAIALWFLSSSKPPLMGPSFPLKDKLQHCLYFAGGGICFLLAWPGSASVFRRSLRKNAFQAMLFTAAIGALDEYHQTFTPGRSGNDPWDWLADISGGLFAAWIIRWLAQKDFVQEKSIYIINQKTH
jgi:hypothetical protein